MFYKPSQGSFGAMNLWMWCHGRHIFQTVWNIWSCAWQSGLLRGCLLRRLLLPWLFWCVHHGFHLPSLGIVSFCKVCFQHLGFSEKSWGLCSILEGSPFDILCLTFFRRRLWSFQNILSCCKFSYNILRLSSARYSCQYFVLSLGCVYMTVHIEELWRYYCPLISLRDRGSEVLGRTDLRMQTIPWEVFYLLSVFVIPWSLRAPWDSSFIFKGVSFVSVFPHVLWGGEK